MKIWSSKVRSKAAPGWPGSAPAVLGFALVVFTALSLSAQPARQTLRGHVPSIVPSLQPEGALAPTGHISLSIGLPLRNRAALSNLLNDLYDPASPNYHHFLTTDEFTRQFGPSEDDYAAVTAFAQSQGLTVTTTHANRVLLGVSGSVADIQRAFQITLNTYREPTENRSFYATAVEPSVPAGLPVVDISGLNNLYRPRPNYRLPQPGAQTVTPKLGTGPGGNFIGNDFRKAYIPGTSLTGAGQTVALVQFDGYFASDIAAYAALAGLPGVPLQNVLINGFSGIPTGTGGDVEVSLDIEMVISMAPGLSKVIVYEGDPFNFDPNALLNRIATDNSARQISSSWSWTGGPNAAFNVTGESIIQQMVAQGQAFFNASGDFDAFLPGQVDSPNYFGTPTASPYVTQVGGTTLTTASDGSWQSETVWNWGNVYGPAYDGVGSSGGVSDFFQTPTWQQGISMAANGGSTTGRNIPDVALTGDNVYVIASGGFAYPGTGGTSCAAPLWAAFTALVNEQNANLNRPPSGFLNPALYAIGKGSNSVAYTSAFHDITTGDNTWSSSPASFFAVAGYDLCTGWGTPNNNMISALTGGSGCSPDGLLEVSLTPPAGAALLASTTEKIFVQVDDANPVTNATVTATVNSTNLVFLNNGAAPDAKAGDDIYSANFLVPTNVSSVTMTFLITAPGKTNSTNVIVYAVVPVPGNDYFTNSTKVSAAGASYFSNNRLASKETGETNHANVTSATNSLWWTWTPTNNTSVLIDTAGSVIDTVLGVYTGNTVSSLTVVVATNNVGSRQQAFLKFNAVAGTPYRIVLASASSNSVGSFRLRIAPGAQPDTTVPAVVVTSPLSGLWTTNRVLNISGTAADGPLNISGLQRVFLILNSTCTYETTGTTNWSTSFGLKPGLNIIKAFAVDASGNVSAPFTVQVTYIVPNPPNDLFANAILLPGNSGAGSVISTNATKEFGEPVHAGDVGGKSVWWAWQAPADGSLFLSTAGSSFDTLLGLYTGTMVSTLTTIAANDDAFSGAPGGFSQITQAVRSGQTYYIAVDGVGGVSGNVNLTYSFTSNTVYRLTVVSTPGGSVTPPSGDYVSNATVVLTAVPDAYNSLAGWTGAVSSVANPLSFVVSSNASLTGVFEPAAFTDDFESGGLQYINWTTSGAAVGNRPWFVQTNVVAFGRYAARSGIISGGQSSSLLLSGNFHAGSGSFDYRVSSEANFDKLKFLMDGVELQQWSGEIGWANFAFPVSAGTHTLEWRYSKDPSVSSGLDAAFLDNVDVPLVVPVTSASSAQMAVVPQTSGAYVVSLLGQTNQLYIIQASSDLVHWENIATNYALNGVIRVADPGSVTHGTRFYRAVAVP